MRVVILTSDEPHHRYLVARMREQFEVVGVVVEPGREQTRRLRLRGKWRDYGWRFYHALRRRVFGLSRYRAAYFLTPPDKPCLEGLEVREVAWINDPAVIEQVRRWRPDVTLVCGTSILKGELIEACGPVVLNIHGGCLPDYKGNHCFFFALYEGAYDKVGSTIHFIDRGVDTGDLAAVVKPPVLPSDDAERLYCRAERLAFDHLCDLLRRFEAGEPLPRRKQPPGGRTIRTSDRKPWHDLVWALKRARGVVRLPSLPGCVIEAGARRDDLVKS